jgi:hypothetical protein
MPRLRKITVDKNGFRSVEIRGTRFGIEGMLERVFGGR